MPFHRGIVASGIPGASPSPPGTPTATTCANAQSVLSWTAPADNGGSAVTDYVVQYSTSATFASSVTTFADGTTSSTGATVTGLSNGTPYYFRVAAVNTYGTSSYSGISTVITPATVPDAPTSVQGTSNANAQSSVSWVAPSGNGNGPPFVYTVQYSTSSTFASAVTTFGTTTSSSPLVVTGLTNGTTYYFRVKATNCAGDSAYSSAGIGIAQVGAIPGTVPSAPTIGTMTLSTTNTTDSLAWTLPASDGGRNITGYVYQTTTNNGSTFAGALATGSTATSKTFNPGYTTTVTKVKVAAINSLGTGPYSEISAVGFGGWSNPSYSIDGTAGCPDCAACPGCPACPACPACTAPTCTCTCDSCAGGCDCGTRTITGSPGTSTGTAGAVTGSPGTITGSPGTITGSKGTRSKTCYKWTRGAQENVGPFNQGGTAECTASFSECTAGTCGCTSGNCGCSAGNCGCAAGSCSACTGGTCGCSGCSDSFVSSFSGYGCTYATGYDGAYTGYYIANALGSGFVWYGAGCGDATACNFGSGLIGTLDMRYCSSGAGAGQWRAYGYACVDVGCC
jgi:hypothetical protein